MRVFVCYAGCLCVCVNVQLGTVIGVEVFSPSCLPAYREEQIYNDGAAVVVCVEIWRVVGACGGYENSPSPDGYTYKYAYSRRPSAHTLRQTQTCGGIYRKYGRIYGTWPTYGFRHLGAGIRTHIKAIMQVLCPVALCTCC